MSVDILGTNCDQCRSIHCLFLVVILILMYAFIVLVLFFFFFCQADFDVDNVQRRELVNLYGV